MKKWQTLALLSLCGLGILIFSAQSYQSNISLTFKELYKERKVHTYPLTIRYPQLAGAQRNGSQFNKKIEELVQEETQKLEEILRETQEGTTSSSYYGTLEYTHTLARNNLISIVFYTHFYTGGAHGNRYLRVFNYDLSREASLTLGDIFKPGSRYLELLSSYCIPQLKNHLEVHQEAENQWIDQGAGPTIANYKNWVFTPQGLKILFDDYQVTCYANGSQEIVIPYTHLKDVLKNEIRARV
jgi:hypothetical protein